MASTQESWWVGLGERVEVEAGRRGGSVRQDQGVLRLIPPDAAGEPIEVVQHAEDGLCTLTAGFVTSITSFYSDYEDHNGVLPLILALMDGRGTETVTIAADGSWLGARSVVEAAGRTVRSDSLVPPHSRRGLPVQHSHARVIEAWRA